MERSNFEYEDYKEYISLARSLPNEMVKRLIQWEESSIGKGKVLKVYADGTAEFPERDQPLLSRIGIRPIVKKRVRLENIGEILDSSFGDSDTRFEHLPEQKTLMGHFPRDYLTVLRYTLEVIQNKVKEYQPVKGI